MEDSFSEFSAKDKDAKKGQKESQLLLTHNGSVRFVTVGQLFLTCKRITKERSKANML
jgi:hypothetical protein